MRRHQIATQIRADTATTELQSASVSQRVFQALSERCLKEVAENEVANEYATDPLAFFWQYNGRTCNIRRLARSARPFLKQSHSRNRHIS